MTNLIQIDTNKNKQCTTHKIRTPTFFRQFFNFYYRLSKMQSYCCEVGQRNDRRVLESVRKAEKKGAPNRQLRPRCYSTIDESVMVKAKYNRGRNLRLPQRWVFGIYDTVQKLGYIVFVTDRSAQTLLPIIERVVRPGSIIHSDGWGAYDRIMRARASQLPAPRCESQS